MYLANVVEVRGGRHGRQLHPVEVQGDRDPGVGRHHARVANFPHVVPAKHVVRRAPGEASVVRLGLVTDTGSEKLISGSAVLQGSCKVEL